jgi:hypothetical protein
MAWPRRRWPLIGISGVLALVLALAVVFTRQQAAARPLEQASGSIVFPTKFVCGLQKPTWPEGGEPPVKPGNYATEVNTFNYNTVSVSIRKQILLLVKETSVPGREPNFVNVSAVDLITLPSNTATMDDCNRIFQLLNPGAPIPTPLPLMIGYINIVTAPPGSNLAVNAVYTAGVPGPSSTGAPAQNVSIDVQEISAKRVP